VARGTTLVRLDPAHRMEAREHANLQRQVAMQRHLAEREPPSGRPRTAALNVPQARPVGPGVSAAAHPAASGAVNHAIPPATTATHPPGTPPPGSKAPPGRVPPGHAPPGHTPPGHTPPASDKDKDKQQPHP
jgi:hypothetical protein